MDDLRILTLKANSFRVFSFRQWKNQLRLIEGCYSEQTGVVSELSTVGAPDETSPLFTFKTVGIPHHPRLPSWPLRALVEARALGVAVAQLKEAIWDCRRVLQRAGISLCVVGVSFCQSFSSTGRCLCEESLRPFSLATCDPGWGAAADWQQMSWGVCSSGDAA